MGGSRGGPQPVASGGGGVAGGAAPAAAGKTGKPRFEFVIVFIWKEPTPSDALMKLTDAAAGLPAGGAPPMPGGR